MRIRSSFTQSIVLFLTLLVASQIFSYYAVFNYALMPSLQQFNKILAHELNLVLDQGSDIEIDAPLRQRVLEQLGVTVHAKDSEASGEYYHAVAIDLMSEEMTKELGSETEVRL
ncbi:two-component system sensor histidine kinase EnvZ, partial [Vibrio sp. 10N.222.51.A6]